MSKRKTNEEFLEQLTERLAETGDAGNYDLSKVQYITESRKIVVKCLKHDLDLQVRPNDWLNGARCIHCGRESQILKRKGNFVEYLEEANRVHSNKYNYSKFEYVNFHTNGVVICKEHGEFSIPMSRHIAGKQSGCSYCSGKKRFIPKPPPLRGKRELPDYFATRFIERAREVHGDKYDYSKVKYVAYKKPVTIGCSKHGDFDQVPDNHINAGSGCPTCCHHVSKPELEVRAFVESLGLACLNNVPILDRKHIDIYIPSKKVGIELCGVYYHREELCGKTYHYDKYHSANSKSIKLLQIFDDEWIFNRDVVASLISYKLGIPQSKSYARSTTFTSIPNREASEFFQSTHMQGGNTPLSLSFGLIKDGVLVSAMSFSPHNHLKEVMSLTRYSSVGSVVGGFSKLLKNAVKVLRGLGVVSIISFSDNRISDGDVYDVNGFTKAYEIPPDYYWVKGNKRYHKMDFRKDKLRNKKGFVFSDTETEYENCIRNKYYRVFDAGKVKWVLGI